MVFCLVCPSSPFHTHLIQQWLPARCACSILGLHVPMENGFYLLTIFLAIDLYTVNAVTVRFPSEKGERIAMHS